MVAYRDRLDRDPMWALEQGTRFFIGESDVQAALGRIVRRLDELEIPYALADGMALIHRGYRHFTEDIDLLVRPDGLAKIHEALTGRGYVELFEGSRSIRDTESGVTIEFIVTGEFPGDGKPKPLAFPDPRDVFESVNGIKCLNLVTLVELKLASGMTAPHRLKELADVQELVKVLHVDSSFAEKLAPYVRDKFNEITASIIFGGP